MNTETDSFEKALFLTATDTITGFVSKDKAKLDRAKKRASDKNYITALPSLSALKKRTRVPDMHKNLIRRSRRCTFIMPDKRSWRIIRDKIHLLLIERLGWSYTTSANLSGEEFDGSFAKNVADITIYPLESPASSPSKIYRLGKKTLKRIR